jgi:hypothetical protein
MPRCRLPQCETGGGVSTRSGMRPRQDRERLPEEGGSLAVFTVRDVRQYGNTKLNIYQVLRLSVASVTAAAGILVPASGGVETSQRPRRALPVDRTRAAEFRAVRRFKRRVHKLGGAHEVPCSHCGGARHPCPLSPCTWAYMSPDRDGSDILISSQGRVIADLQGFLNDEIKEMFGDAPAKDRRI